MIRRALTFIVNRLVFMAVFLLALNAFTQGSSCQSGNARGIAQTLGGLPEALRVLSNSFR